MCSESNWQYFEPVRYLNISMIVLTLCIARELYFLPQGVILF